MWKISNYSLNYSAQISRGEMDVPAFLRLCRQLDLGAASLHMRNLASTETDYLRTIRRAMLDNGLSTAMLGVSPQFGRAKAEHQPEYEKVREAVQVASFLGVPLVRVFAGSPPNEAGRAAAFDRAAAAIHNACEQAAKVGVPIGLQNHNHGALVRTGAEALSFIKKVNHPNFVFILDCGQFAGSPGSSLGNAQPVPGTDYLESIRMTAPLAKHVRVKFYQPGPDGADELLDYPAIFNILQSVHYSGFLDIVYEPRGEDISTAMPRIVGYLKRQLASAPAADGTARYSGLKTAEYFPSSQVGEETAVAFLEGPACDRAGNVFFTNTTAERIMRYSPRSRKLTVFRERSNAANGLHFDRQGRLLACEGGAERVTRTNMRTGKIEVLAENFQGQPLGKTNDLALDGKGRIYFTSRFGTDLKPGQANGVYRIDPDGGVHRLLATPQIDMPNGIVTSPDDRTLYLIDADGREAHTRQIRAYQLGSDGTVGKERLLYNFYPGRSGDGMTIDAEGNLYVAAGLHRRRGSSETLDTRPGIHVVSPAGKLLAMVETPEDTITNCTFGGKNLKTLYIACGKKLLSLRTRIAGKSLYRPEA